MRKSIFIILLLPLVYLLSKLFIFQDVNDPIKYIYSITGTAAIVILFFTTTLSLWFKKLVKYIRLIGLFGFFYAVLHMSNFLILDMELDLFFAYEETIDKPFIYLGMISFIFLAFMSITSTKKLFKKYNKYHKILYLVLFLTTIHFVDAQKSLTIPQYGYLTVILTIFIFKIRKTLLKIKINKYLFNKIFIKFF